MEQVGLTMTVGLLGGSAFNVGHELIHRPRRIDAVLGFWLLCSVSYPTFQIVHLAHHHKWVATDYDPSSAPRGRSLYTHVPRAIGLNFIEAAKIGWRRTHSLGGRNSMARALVGLCMTYFVIGLLLGPLALAFFFGQSLVAIAWLETANYFQHYGLRRTLVDGHPEPVQEHHS